MFCTSFEKSCLGTVVATAIVAQDYTALAFWQRGAWQGRQIPSEAQSAWFDAAS